MYDLENLNLQNLKKSFQRASYIVDFSKHFKDQAFKVTNARIANSERPELVSYIAPALVGKLTSKINTLEVVRVDKWGRENCQVQDAPAPAGCYSSIEVTLPIEISFDLSVQTSPTDCRNVSYPYPGCG